MASKFQNLPFSHAILKVVNALKRGLEMPNGLHLPERLYIAQQSPQCDCVHILVYLE